MFEVEIKKRKDCPEKTAFVDFKIGDVFCLILISGLRRYFLKISNTDNMVIHDEDGYYKKGYTSVTSESTVKRFLPVKAKFIIELEKEEN